MFIFIFGNIQRTTPCLYDWAQLQLIATNRDKYFFDVYILYNVYNSYLK